MPAAKYRPNQPPHCEETTDAKGQKELRAGIMLVIKDPRNIKFLKALIKAGKSQKDLGDEFIDFLVAKKIPDTLKNERDYLAIKQHRMANLFANEMKQLFAQFANFVVEKILDNDEWLDGKNPNLEE